MFIDDESETNEPVESIEKLPPARALEETDGNVDIDIEATLPLADQVSNASIDDTERYGFSLWVFAVNLIEPNS